MSASTSDPPSDSTHSNAQRNALQAESGIESHTEDELVCDGVSDNGSSEADS